MDYLIVSGKVAFDVSVHQAAPVVGWYTVHLVGETLEHVGGVVTTEVVVAKIFHATLFFRNASEEVNK